MPESIVENNPKSVEQEEQNNVSTRTYSINEFADVIKKKYPEYKDVDNKKLATSIVAKYPEYKDRVDLTGEQDKVISEKPKSKPVEQAENQYATWGRSFPQSKANQEKAIKEGWFNAETGWTSNEDKVKMQEFIKTEQAKVDKPKESINYKKQSAINKGAYDKVKNKINNNKTLSKEERDAKIKKLNDFAAKKEAKLKDAVENQYVEELTTIATEGAPEEVVNDWYATANLPTESWDPTTNTIVKSSPYEEYIDAATKSLTVEGKDKPKEWDIKQLAVNMYVEDQNSKWKSDKSAELMERGETDFGIDRTKTMAQISQGDFSEADSFGGAFNLVANLGSLLTAEGREEYRKNLSEADKKIIDEQGPWAAAAMITSRDMAGSQGKQYYDFKTSVYSKLDVKQKELEKEYADKVNSIVSRGDAIKNEIEELNSYEAEFTALQKKGERVPNDRYAEYKALYNKVEVDRALYDKDVEELGDKTIPSNDFETIKNLTLKTYDNLEMVQNNVVSSVVTLGAGLGTLVHELTLPEMIKWSGMDIESEEGLTALFGEEESFLKELARDQGQANIGVTKVLDSVHKVGNAIKGQNAPVPSISDVDSLGDFGMYLMDLGSGQMVNTALTVAFPPAGLAILASGATGGKMYEMNKEMEGVKWTEQELASFGEDGPPTEYKVAPVNYNPLEYFTTAAMVGGAEYLTEKVSLGILKGGFKNFQKAFDLTKGKGSNITLRNLTTPKQLAKIGYDFGKGAVKEGGAEGIVQLTSNFADIMVLGKKDVSILDGMVESMAAGAFMGTGFSGPPAIASMVTTAFSSESEFAQANKLNKQLVSLSQQRDKILAQDPSDADGSARKIQDQIEQTLDKQMESMNKVRQRTLDMTPADRQNMIDQYNFEHHLRAEIDEINNSQDYTDEVREIMINDRIQELAESEAIRARTLSDATFNADIKRQADLSTQIRAENGTLDMVEYVVADNADSALDQGLAKIDAMDLTDQQKSALKSNLTTEFNDMKAKSASGESYNGFAWGDNIQIETQKDGKMVTETLNVPMTFALNKNNATVASHELGHQTMFKQFIENNPDAVGLVDDLEAYVKKNYKTAYANFNAVRAAYETEGLSQEQMAEEQLANLSDFMRMNNLQGDKTLHNKLFGRFQKVNDGNNQIETGKDVFDMLTSYNQSFETGQLQGLAKSVIKGKAKVKRKKQADSAKQQISDIQANIAATGKKGKGMFSLDIQDETPANKKKRQDTRNKRSKEIFEKLALDEKGNPLSNEQWRDNITGSKEMGELLMMNLPDVRAIAIKAGNKNPDEVVSATIEPLMKDILAMKPNLQMEATHPIAGYIGQKLGWKTGTGAKKVAKKTPTISIEQEGVKQVVEKQDTSQTSTSTVAEKQLPKFFIKDRLGDKAKAIDKKVKAMASTVDLKGKGYKQTPKLALKETVEMFMSDPKATYIDDGGSFWKTPKGKKALGTSIAESILNKIENNAALNSQDIKAVQQFLMKNRQTLISGALAEGTDPSGKSTGMAKVLLDKFYSKGGRVKAAKTGSTQGLAKQTKIENIDESVYNEMFGITSAGTPNVQNISISSQPVKAMIRATEKILTNQALRQAVPEATKMGEGKSKVMYAKSTVLDKKSDILKKKGQELIPLNKAGVEASTDFMLGDLINVLGEAGLILMTPSVYSNAGNRIRGFDKKTGKPKKNSGALGRGFRFISSLEATEKTYGKNSKEYKEALQAVSSGEIGDLTNIINEAKNTLKQLKDKPLTSKQIGLIKQALGSQVRKRIDLNLETINDINKGKDLILDKLRELVEKDIKNLSHVGDITYHANSNANPFRNLATVIGEMVGLKPGEKTWEEHMLPFGEFSNVLLNSLTTSPKIYEGFKNWIKENYWQEVIDINTRDILDQTTRSLAKDGKTVLPAWASKDQMHPLLAQHIQEALEGKRAWNDVVNADIRKYNEYISPKGDINPNRLQRNGVTDAARYNVEVPNNLSNNTDVIALQNDLIYQQLIGKIDAKEAKQLLKDGLPVKIQQSKSATPANVAMLKATGVTKASKNLNNEQTVREAGILDKALDVARDPNAPVKKIRVFDFDDTLARTKSNVLYTMPDGKTGKLTPAEYAAKGTEMLEQGAEFDFSEFNKVMDGRKGPMFKVAETIAEKRGTSDMFVLTARSADAAPAIKEFLDALGLNIPIENITGLGDSSPLAKSGWMVNKAAEGYNDFYFADDHLGNVKAVEKVMDLVDVKSKVQQAKIKFSKDVDQIFNDIIENKTGILSAKEYSAAKAKTVGAKKGRWKFWIAPSAEDFVGLLYPLLGKGALGDTQMAWFKEHLLDPYGRAMENLSRRQNRLSNDFKALKKALVKGGSIPKNLNKKAFDKWTYQDLSRVAAWHTQGFDIPGLSKADLNEMLDFIRENPGIKTFADQLIMINKGDGYAKPGKDWLAGTISTDLLDGLRTDGRSEYLQEWKANKDLIFSEKNLNKLEAAYGPKYREALEDMLRRMETGKNRTSTGNRLENRLLDYINNSVGTVMFLNMRSGVLQTLSAVNFLNWSDNNPLKAGAAFANQPRYWKDFMKLMNSDFLVDRRNGLKINVSESEIADAARTSKNKAKAVVSYLLKKGFTVTQIMDSFAIASGGATFYRNRIKKYVKQGMTQADAEAKAYLDFREVAEESQQSARPDRISQQQASALGRVILAFANTPMQYNRIMKKAFLDLKNGRGDAKTHISKMIYYGAIQNMMFVALQQAMFAMAFDDEEEPDEVKRKKYMKMGNSMMDNILRGLGIWGTAASTLIAITKKAIEESQKEGYPGADYDAAAMELLNFSPPIDIKVSKLRQAGSNWKYEGWKHDEAAWSMKDPAYKSAAYIISSLTNIPVDRFYKKMDNIQSALDSNNETWKRVANILGWANWELESDAERKERRADEKVRKKDIRDKKKEEAAIEEAKAKEAAMTPAEKKAAARQKKFDGYKALSKKEQVDKLLELGLTKAEIRALKYEKDRVDKLIELEE